MRHSDINLTMSLYTHTLAGQEADAVAALPSLDTSPVTQRAKATGTDNAVAGNVQAIPSSVQAAASAKADFVLSSSLARTGGFSHILVDDGGRVAKVAENEKHPENIGKIQHFQGVSSLKEVGLEPTTYALKVRCSTN